MKNKKCKKETEQCECKKCKESKMCFKWVVTRALNPVDKDSEQITKKLREQAEKYDWSRITFPVRVKDIHIWKKNNKNKININVFGYDEETKTINSIKLCDNYTNIVLDGNEQSAATQQESKFINLFLHDDNHYCVVKNLSRLVSSQLSNRQHKSTSA